MERAVPEGAALARAKPRRDRSRSETRSAPAEKFHERKRTEPNRFELSVSEKRGKKEGSGGTCQTGRKRDGFAMGLRWVRDALHATHCTRRTARDALHATHCTRRTALHATRFVSGSTKRQPWLKDGVTEDPRAAMERAVPEEFSGSRAKRVSLLGRSRRGLAV